MNRVLEGEALVVYHFLRPEAYAHRLVCDLAGELNVLLVSGDCGLARRSGFGKKEDGVLNLSLRVFFIRHVSGQNFAFALFGLKKGVVLEEFFVMLRERGHVRHAQDKLTRATIARKPEHSILALSLRPPAQYLRLNSRQAFV